MKSNLKQNILFLFCVGGAFGLGLFWGDIFGNETSIEKFTIKQSLSDDEIQRNLDKIEYVYNYVVENHINAKEIDKQQMWDNALEGLVKGVDGGLTRYYAPVKEDIVENDIEGTYEGTGIQIDKTSGGNSYIEGVDENSDSSGKVANGDTIIAVNGVNVKGKSVDEINKMIESSDKVTLTLKRDGEKIKKTIKNKTVKPSYVSYQIVDGINYLKIDTFNEKAVEEMRGNLNKIKDDSSLVIDLRGNYGGNLDSYEQIIDLFVEKGIHLYSKRTQEGTEKIESQNNQKYSFDEIVVLVNHQTASSSELLASNLRDILGATLIGTQTYGKGTIQSIIHLPDDSYLYISDKEYLTSKGKSIQGVGLTPDIVEENYQKQLERAFEIIRN